MILDYVSSGNSSLKIFSDNITSKIDTPEIQAVLKIMKGLSTENRKYSVLFNAYTEIAIGKALHSHFKPYINSIHADSGGLQMITLGKSITEEEKIAIYDVQGKYSDVAMCFDQIPITTSGTKTGITDMSVRFFNSKLVKEKATATAVNLKNQILRFKETGSLAKPMLIMQGNCMSSFQDWVNYACDELGDLTKDVYGISVAGTSLGGGQLEDVVRAAASTILDFPKELNSKNIHILGLGAPARMLPYASFKSILNESNISFDSTTISHSIFKGVFMDGFKVTKWDKLNQNKKQVIINKVNALIEPHTELRVSIQSIDEIYAGSIKYETKTGKLGAHCEKFIFNIFCIFALMVSINLDTVEDLFKQKLTYIKLAEQRGGYGAYKALELCRDTKDFSEWYGKFAKYLNSNKVTNINDKVSLEDFF